MAVDLISLRKSSYATWGAASATQRGPLVKAACASLEERCAAAFLLQAALASGWPDAKIGRVMVDAGVAHLATIARRREAGRLIRDFHCTAGNHFARWSEGARAAAAYRRAERGESGRERRALVRHNLAKLHLVGGEPYAALRILEPLLRLKLEEPRLACAIRLTLVRCHLIFGNAAVADRMMAGLRGRRVPPELASEFRYLALIGRFDVRRAPAFRGRIADFEAAVAAHAASLDAWRHAVYALDALLFRLVLWPESIKNHERTQIRATHLARIARLPTSARLARGLRSALGRAPRKSSGEALAKSLGQLLRTDHVLTARIVAVGACLRLAEKGRLAAARRVFETLEVHAGEVLGPAIVRGATKKGQSQFLADLAWLARLAPPRGSGEPHAWLFNTD